MKRIITLCSLLAIIATVAYGQSYQFGSTSSVAVTSVSDGTDNLGINADGSINVVSTATNLDIRDLTDASDSVSIGDGTDTMAVEADGSINVNVAALLQSTDSVAIGDGTDLIAISAAGEASVQVTQPIPAGTNNIGDVDVATIAAGDNNIGNVDLASAIPAGTNNIGDVDIASALPAGTNNIGSVETAGKASVEVIRNDHSSTAVTTGAYVQLVASTSGDINRFHIFDSSGQALILATGAAASEVDVAYIPPGGLDAPLDLFVASGTRLSVKALTGNTSTGDLIITALD